MDSTTDQFPIHNSPAPETIPYCSGFPKQQPSRARRVFIGPFGLRAGWSLLIYVCILAALVAGIRFGHEAYKAREHQAAVAAARAAGRPAPAKPDKNAPMVITAGIEQEGTIFAIIVLLSVIMAAIERRRFTAYGLGGQRPFGRFFIGAVWGLIAVALLVGALRLLHLVVFDAQLDHGWQILRWGAAQFVLFLLVGLFEEYLFRGYLQFTLTRGLVGLGNLISRTHARCIAFWTASLITAALFFLAHTGNSGEDAVGLLLVFLAGVAFVVALWRTGSLWWAIGFHTAWDWSQSFLYGVPDSGTLIQGRLFATHAIGNPFLSGGTDGPEGSVFCIPILLLVIVVLYFTKPSPLPPLETKAQLAIPAEESFA